MLDWYWSRQSEVYILVETHLDPQQHQQTCQYFTIRGRTAFGTPAVTNESNTGTHGGILVLGDPSCGLTPLESFTNQGCGFQAFLWQATECTILVAGIYMKTGETLQSDTNATILARLLALIQATNHPFVLLGDWQNSPGSITSTVLPSKFHFEVLAPDHSILSGNVIDYALIHSQLAGTTALTTDWAIPWRPHALLNYHFNIEEATKEYRQIQYLGVVYRAVSPPRASLGSPRPGSKPQGDLQAAGTKHHGDHLETRWFAYGEQLKIRFQLALKQPPQQAKGPTMGFMQAIHDAPKHWVGPPTWGQFLDTCHHTGVAMLQIWSTTPLGTNFKKPNTPPMMKVTSNTKNGCSKPRPKGSKGSSAAFEVVS